MPGDPSCKILDHGFAQTVVVIAEHRELSVTPIDLRQQWQKRPQVPFLVGHVAGKEDDIGIGFARSSCQLGNGSSGRARERLRAGR